MGIVCSVLTKSRRRHGEYNGNGLVANRPFDLVRRIPMKALLAVAASLVFLVGVGAQDNDTAVKKDKERFKGTWKFESIENAEGKLDDFDSATLSFDGDKLEFKKGDEVKKATFTLNPAGKPKEIDFKSDDNKEMAGIYKFGKDTLTMCICLEPNQARPTEFAAKNASVLAVLKRVKQ
jgi:uncharacterized protein (TIGR03067 family)